MENVNVNTTYKNLCYYDSSNKIRFDPPVYEQRYISVLNILELEHWKSSIKKVVEFGCAEMKFFTLLKSLKFARHIVEIDIDENLLTRNVSYVKPMLCDFVKKKDNEFMVDIYRGSISVPHECLRETDAVIGIEIIEHLFPETLEDVPYNIFGYMQPKLVIFTTPNSEMNVLFDGLLETGFRHDDHKFEWTREQFQDWGDNLCVRYPEYLVKYFGIGPGPDDKTELGCVSQMAVFVRQDFLMPNISLEVSSAKPQPSTSSTNKTSMYLKEEINEIVLVRTAEEEIEDSDDEIDMTGVIHVIEEDVAERTNVPPEENNNEPLEDEYKHLFHFDFPVVTVDDRPIDQKILASARYQIRRLKNFEEDYYDFVDCIYKIPLQTILNCLLSETDDLDDLKRVLRADSFKINDEDILILSPSNSSNENSEDEFYCDDDDVEKNIENPRENRSLLEENCIDEEW